MVRRRTANNVDTSGWGLPPTKDSLFKSFMYPEAGESEEVEEESPQYTQQYSAPSGLTREQMTFLIESNDVPKAIEGLWSLKSRHNSLTNFFDKWELDRQRILMRCIARPMMWQGRLTFLDFMQLQHYHNNSTLKSYQQRERKLLAPQLQEITRTDLTPNAGMQGGPPRGLFGRIMGRLTGR
jgi:hypothetical protein